MPSATRRSWSCTRCCCARRALRSTAAAPALPHLRGDDYDDLAQQSADDALVAILRKLDDFRGESRFTTWAYKFALYEAAAKRAQARLAGTRDPARSRRRGR